MTDQSSHIPVMLKETIEHLNLRPGATIVDCTLGLGGHSASIADKIGASGRLVCIDRDYAALSLAREKLKGLPCTFHFVQADFRNMNEALATLKIPGVDGILFDLGLSSFQLNDPKRGFSFNADGPLDMRMDQDSHISAYDLVNSLSERELSLILKNFGEERWHHRIAKYLVVQREKHPIDSTRELSDTIIKAIPARFRHQKMHAATRSFQALRIAVNRELESLEKALSACLEYLNPEGRICVIAFHSLEDRIVKEKFRNWAHAGQMKLITKKPLRPTEEEVAENSRSRSARLRVAQKNG